MRYKVASQDGGLCVLCEGMMSRQIKGSPSKNSNTPGQASNPEIAAQNQASTSRLGQLTLTETGVNESTCGIAAVVIKASKAAEASASLAAAVSAEATPTPSGAGNTMESVATVDQASSPAAQPSSRHSSPHLGTNSSSSTTGSINGGSSGSGGGGGGGGGGKGVPTDGTDPDDEPANSHGGPEGPPPRMPCTVVINEAKIKSITAALAAVAQAVRDENSASCDATSNLLRLRADVYVLTEDLKDATLTATMAFNELAALRSSAERLADQIAGVKQNGKEISRDLEELAKQAKELAESLTGAHVKQFIDGLKDVKAAVEGGATTTDTLIQQIFQGLHPLKDPKKLDPEQLKQIIAGIDDLKAVGASGAPMMRLVLKELQSLRITLQEYAEREKKSEGKDDSKQSDRVRDDYPVISEAQKQSILNLFATHLKNLRDPNCNPYTLDTREVISKLSEFQKDPKDLSKLWIDENCTYRTRAPSQFDVEIRKEIQDYLTRSELLRNEMMVSDYMKKYRTDNPRASAKQLNTALIEAYIDGWCNNKTVAFMHILVPPIINDKVFRVRYVTAQGNIRTFEMDVDSFRRDLNKCHAKGRGVLWTAGLTVAALSVGTAAIPAATSLIAGSIWALGCLGLVNASWNLGLRRRSTSSNYNSLVFTETLDLALNATSSAAIFLPVLAHYHFIRTCPKHTRALELGNRDMVGNSPIKYLQKHLLLFDFLVKKWEVFETNCDDFSTRVLNVTGVTNMRQREVDEQKLRVIREDAKEFEGTVMRWATVYHWTAWATTIAFSFGIGTIAAGAFLAPFKLAAMKLWPFETRRKV
jgi:hypothetical protein